MKKPGFFERFYRAGFVQHSGSVLEGGTLMVPVQRLAEDTSVENDAGPQSVTIHYDPVGSSGVQNFAGYPYEEYLSELSGVRAATIYDKMRRSEPKIKMVLSAVKNIIKAATWEVEPGKLDDEATAQQHADFITHVLFKDMDKPWRQLLNEILTVIDFGHAVFEITHKTVLNNSQFGSYHGIRSIGLRSAKTVQRFNLDPDTGKLVSISQQAIGDLQRFVDIPAEYLIVFTLEKEGDNYEGVSMLRPCFGPWLRKQTYLKLEAIGIEKFAIPTPVGKIPDGKESSAQAANFKATLAAWSSHESNYITVPAGWEISFVKNDFDPAKIRASIDGESKEIADAFVAGFLALGDKGSYARSFNESDFFLNSIEYIAETIAETITLNLVKDLIDLNFGPQEAYPVLKYSGISDRGGKELSDALKSLCDSKTIIPDDDLEEHVRKRFKFPKKGELGQRYGGQIDQGVSKGSPDAVGLPDASTVPDKTPGLQPGNMVHAEKRIRLAEKKAKQQIEAGKVLLKKTMQDGLTPIAGSLITQIMKKVRKLPESQQLNAIKNLNVAGMTEYRNSLRATLASIAYAAVEQARREVPKAKNVKLSDPRLRLAEFDKLPSDLQKKVDAQSALIADTQQADLEKAVYFQFTNSADSTDSDSILENDLSQSADDFIAGPSILTGAATIVATIVNKARQSFFSEPEVLEEIHSFTFVNGDPVSPICQDLAGTTFSKDDPEADRFYPPLHHNCRSYIVPNLVGGSEPDIESLKPSSPDLEKYMTLSECGHDHG